MRIPRRSQRRSPLGPREGGPARGGQGGKGRDKAVLTGCRQAKATAAVAHHRPRGGSACSLHFRFWRFRIDSDAAPRSRRRARRQRAAALPPPPPLVRFLDLPVRRGGSRRCGASAAPLYLESAHGGVAGPFEALIVLSVALSLRAGPSACSGLPSICWRERSPRATALAARWWSRRRSSSR